MRFFKNKWVARWAHAEDIADSILLQAAVEVVAGHVEADLGGYLFKKRLAREGSGKRGSYRVLIGYQRQNAERIIFLYAFAKNAKANISDKEKEALSLVAEAFISATDVQIALLLKEGSIVEVQHHE
jgi:hypothetical protein